ncbi:alternative NAD(P)H-ubiquinone oxidoreductase C1, chloroplastic/mitochondrial-like [Olea europaea var. sylvestris]|uniref:alternative NAD(P)H-ubiquinone oxidoreductase C1, chloroplastic/mitochondrial-like n=1 Tax=Olea europaea var. sylvestris TaxID=158386 RepID=UPI000C1D501F|nr:alternative NAD(P)H-ubiquinone oxidoreductase C1, chloroplastic/mitochondrial-like [Olea europaea var. sylvestris]XP_022864327.1 alternative NAD(P)H-ubiquinone oxidoreductase C1, chloroplastic/mitochondrial-like [Olea europaea var. sylvestris]
MMAEWCAGTISERIGRKLHEMDFMKVEPNSDQLMHNEKSERLNEKLTALELKNFGKDSPIRITLVGCGYSGVELAVTILERLQVRDV